MSVETWLREGKRGPVLRSVREVVRGPSHAVFIDMVYRALLWREPDESGLRNFVRELRRGQRSRFDVLRQVARSPEAAKHMMFGPGYREYVQSFTVNGMNVGPGVRPVVFLHPMKCGGTALAQGLSRLADPWPRILDVWVDHLVCFPRPMLSQLKLLTGHLPYGVVEVLPDDVATCTVIREPVSRALSHFSHLRTHGGQSGLTIEEFVHAEKWRLAWVNYQARQLAVDVPVGDAWRGTWNSVLQALIDEPAPMPDEELRSRAFERLEAIEIVGVSDDLDAVVRTVAGLWKKDEPPPLERENTSLAPVRRSDVPPALIDELVAGTQIDAEIYERAQERAKQLA